MCALGFLDIGQALWAIRKLVAEKALRAVAAVGRFRTGFIIYCAV
jgi:hypothetical protein